MKMPANRLESVSLAAKPTAMTDHARRCQPGRERYAPGDADDVEETADSRHLEDHFEQRQSARLDIREGVDLLLTTPRTNLPTRSRATIHIAPMRVMMVPLTMVSAMLGASNSLNARRTPARITENTAGFRS